MLEYRHVEPNNSGKAKGKSVLVRMSPLQVAIHKSQEFLAAFMADSCNSTGTSPKQSKTESRQNAAVTCKCPVPCKVMLWSMLVSQWFLTYGTWCIPAAILLMDSWISRLQKPLLPSSRQPTRHVSMKYSDMKWKTRLPPMQLMQLPCWFQRG